MTYLHRRCAGPVQRREFLAAGVLGLGGMVLPDLFRYRARAAAAGGCVDEEKSIIFVWLPGGPPHLDMYDMKPNAPIDYRGAFLPIQTNVSGMDVCELMPRHAAIADKYAIVRSLSHQFSDHGGGHKRMMTGRDPKSPVDFVNDSPAVGSIVAKKVERRSVGVPNYNCVVEANRDQVDTFSLGGAYLGPAYTPFMIPGDPSLENFTVPNISPQHGIVGRLDDRVGLLRQFDRFRRETDQKGIMGSIDQYHSRAMNLLSSDKARKAFDLSLEPASLRDRYGRHAWGQRLLLARRLVEAGATFVTVVLGEGGVSQPARTSARGGGPPACIGRCHHARIGSRHHSSAGEDV